MQENNDKLEKIFWLQGYEGRVVQGNLYRSDIAAIIKLQEDHSPGHVVGIKISEKKSGKPDYTIQFIINTGDDVPTRYENKQEMKDHFDRKHGTTEFNKGKLFDENDKDQERAELFVDPRKKEIMDE